MTNKGEIMKYKPYEKYINFLKNHNIYNEEILMYIREFATYFDYYNENEKNYPACTFPVVDKEKRRIIGIRTIIPVITDDITTIINIQEYIKVLLYYSKLGEAPNSKPNTQIELTLQVLYTKLFILENPTKQLQELEISINEDTREECKEALRLTDKLHEVYDKRNTDIHSLIEMIENSTKTPRKKKKKKPQKTYYKLRR